MNKKISLGATIAFCAIVAVVTFAFTWMMMSSGAIDRKLTEINAYVQEKYVGEIDDAKVEQCVATGYMVGLDDPYAAYYTAQELSEQKQSAQGTVTGIGVTCTMDASGYLSVKEVYPNSPAQQAGFAAGDLIISIDGEDLRNQTMQEASDKLRGEVGSEVTVVTRRDGTADINHLLTRQTVEIPSVSYHMEGANGYIKISGFNQGTIAQFQTALNTVIQQGATGLIFDLRDNSGGTLDSVCKILDSLLPEGPIVSKTDKDGTTEILETSDASECSLPMVTIANENTASAAELFVCTLKDYGKAQQVGTTTYGKGVLQDTHTLKDGSAIKVTTGYFNPPKSENFNEVGVVTDFEVTLSDQQKKQWQTGTLSVQDDSQFQKAVEVLTSKS